MIQRLLLFLLILGILGCAEGQKPNPLSRTGTAVNTQLDNPLPKGATK
jgi:hypothetical protein